MRELPDTGPGGHRASVTGPAGPAVLAVQGEEREARLAARALLDRLRVASGVAPVVLVAAVRDGEVRLVGPQEPGEGPRAGALPGPAAGQGAVPATSSPLGPLLREGLARGASVLAVVAAEPRDESEDWLRALLSPVADRGFDLVCPAYCRHRTGGAINSGIVAPLLRCLYGQSLRQPLGTELALSPSLARRLLGDQDWSRRPAEAGSDAWVLAKTMGTDARLAQVWLRSWPSPRSQPEEASQSLVRALGLVFTEMERDATRWQRGRPGLPVVTFGAASFEPGDGRLDPEALAAAFVAGLRDLRPLLDLVLPPATLLGLQRAAASGGDAAGIADRLWARVIFDFAVAHMAHTVERRQLLSSLTPIYLGWLAGLARDAAALGDEAFSARLDAVGEAFAAEKRYLVARWRWPDDFNP